MDYSGIHKAILDNMSEAVYVIDRGMRILFANPAAENLTGYPVEEAVGKQCGDIFCERSEICEGKCPPKKSMKEGLPILHKDAETRSKNGELRQTQISISPFFEEGECVGSVIVIKDITQLKRAEDRIRHQNAFLCTVIDALPHPFYVIDASSYRLELANRSACPGPLAGNVTCYQLTHRSEGPCSSEDHPCPFDKVKRTGKAVTVEHIHYDNKGKARNMEVHCFPIRDDQGKVVRVGEYSIDITERKIVEQELEHMAFFDALTELPNRSLFFDRMHHAVEMAKRDIRLLGLLFLDLDQFKTVNDNFGHTTGDLLLKEAARRMRSCIRASDTIARMGGDEFAVILTEIAKRGDAAVVAKKIIEAFAEPFCPAGHECSLGVSIGISLYPSDGSDTDTLLKRADTAMYLAKREPGSFFCFSS